MGLPTRWQEQVLPTSGFPLGAGSSHSEPWEMTQRLPSTLCLSPPPYLHLEKLFWSCTMGGETLPGWCRWPACCLWVALTRSKRNT